MRVLVMPGAVIFLLLSASPARASCAPTDPTGYFEGTAQSKEAGPLKVTLNLRCDAGAYAGELVTPVGTFAIDDGAYSAGRLMLRFGGGPIADQGTIDVEISGPYATGTFKFGDDSGTFAISRVGRAHPAVSDTPDMTISKPQWHADLTTLVKTLTTDHPEPYYTTPKATIEEQVASLDARLDQLDPDQIYMGLDHVANLIGDGHTYVEFPPDPALFGIVVERFGDDYRVVEAVKGSEAALGSRVLAIGSTPIRQAYEEVYDAITPVAETDTLRDARAQNFLDLGIVLHGVGIIPDRRAADYLLEDDTGRRWTFQANALNPDDDSRWTWAWKRRPLFHQRPADDFWFTYIAQARTVYCSFRAYENLKQNGRSLLAFIDARKPEKVVIDLRLNSGGDFKEGFADLISPLARLPSVNRKGHLFVLIGPDTFSAAMSNAAQFRRYTNATLVGGPIGERPNSFQEANEMRLPNSRLLVRYSTRYYSFAPGAAKDEIDPDVAMTTTWSDFKAGDDAALDWILGH